VSITANDVATLLAQLTARASYGQFALNVATTSSRVFLDHPFVRLRPRGPAPWALVGWNAVYRPPSRLAPIVGHVAGAGAAVTGYDEYAFPERRFGMMLGAYSHAYEQDPAETVACDLTDSVMAQWLMLTWAKACFDGHDARSQQAARPPPRLP